MRTLIDIPEPIAEALTEIGARRKRSRASVVREALGEYVSRHRAGSLDAAFGLWGKSAGDGLAWQRKIRSEW